MGQVRGGRMDSAAPYSTSKGVDLASLYSNLETVVSSLGLHCIHYCTSALKINNSICIISTVQL